MKASLADIEQTLREQFPHGHKRFIPMLVDMMALHSDKNRDYTADNDKQPLGNFNRVAAILGLYGPIDFSGPHGPALVALTYGMKQWDAAMVMLTRNFTGKVEGVPQRLTDQAMYDLLAILLEAGTES